MQPPDFTSESGLDLNRCKTKTDGARELAKAVSTLSQAKK
jgi:hypothetical protein